MSIEHTTRQGPPSSQTEESSADSVESGAEPALRSEAPESLPVADPAARSTPRQPAVAARERAEERNSIPPDEDSPESRRQEFDTVPGGGANRLSGGRAAARAYVGPRTPVPVVHGRLDTVSVDLGSSVGHDERVFETSPSLQRRRVSETELGSLPPVSYEKDSWGRGMLLLVVSALLAFAVVFFLRARPGASEVTTDTAKPTAVPVNTPPANTQPTSAAPANTAHVPPTETARPADPATNQPIPVPPPAASAPAVPAASPNPVASPRPKSVAPSSSRPQSSPSSSSSSRPSSAPPTKTDPWLE